MPSPTGVILASAFVGSLGINTHISFQKYGYENLDTVAKSLTYLGIANVRDSLMRQEVIPMWQQVASTANVKFDDFMPEGSPQDMQNALDLVPRLAAAGLLNYVEGGNEEDDAYPKSLGNTIAHTAEFQQQVYSVAHALGLPVINMSFGSGWTAANKWRGNYDKVGDLSNYADFANAHTYPAKATGQPHKTILMLNANANLAAISKPVIMTELGWKISDPGDTSVAKHLLYGLLDGALEGNVKTYIYALYDDQSGRFGVMNTDGTPRPAGAAIHNLTTLLADNGGHASRRSTDFSYRLGDATGGERTLLMEKSNGTYWLAVWDETGGDHAITLNLAFAAKSIGVFDPLMGTQRQQAATNTATLPVNLGDHPLLIEIVPGAIGR